MTTVAKANCTILADLLAAYGVENAVLCPGSRNAPVSLAIDRSPIKTYVIVDERTAAFVALGMAKMSRKPTAVVCTSGTALLNCAPAVAEAYYARVPLIVVSADRPERWIDQRDSQTIRQAGALANIVRQTVNVPDNIDNDYANLLINQALSEATGDIQGPVHINMPLDRPLTAMCEDSEAASGHKISVVKPVRVLNHVLDEFYSSIFQSEKVLFVAGSGCNLSGCTMPRLNNVAFLADLSANCPDAICSPTALDHFRLDESYRPDLIVNFGGTIISDNFKSFMRRCNSQVWNIGADDTLIDTFGSLKCVIELSPRTFIQGWNDYVRNIAASSSSAYRNQWVSLTTEDICAPHIFSDWRAMLTIDTEAALFFKGKHNLFIANGMVARYAQLCCNSACEQVLDQRGVSGIDGCTSTAIGASMVSELPMLFLTGDMGAAYDIGALAVDCIKPNFKMVVFDNCGGDIFRHVATTRGFGETERLFIAKPKLPLAELANAYGFRYFMADNPGFLQQNIAPFLAENSVPAILHIKTQPSDNLTTYNSLFK